jgi:hypothetical protein
MVHALAAHYPFTNGEALLLYHPSPAENYFAVAPGIEVSVEPYDHKWTREDSNDLSVYNRQGKMIQVEKKGHFIDSTL